MKILNADVLEGFVGSVLAKRFDGSIPTPAVHREWWELCTGPDRFVAIAAPRGFAKSTAITFSFTLAAILFRERQYVLIISDTESQAVNFLNLIKQELNENEDIRRLFQLRLNEKGTPLFLKDSEADLIGVFSDGQKFRIQAKGSEQKLRGLLWSGQRPDLIVCHEKNTEIYTPETGWILNQDYPNAQELPSDTMYEIKFSDGHIERVTPQHRFLTQDGWKFAWMMTKGDNVEENITNDMLNDILKEKKNLLKSITISQRLKQGLQRGLRVIVLNMILLKVTGQKTILNKLKQTLRNIARNILVGWQHNVQKDALENTERRLLG
ncbi:MAG: hypothetical protein NUV80_06465 [Candidatus Berkelbacteria bacterium]|nr:hypothetical protein [Candidatus Berkelbacteria bacterium]